MRTLEEIYQNHSTPVGDGDKGTLHSYIPIYSKILENYRCDINFLEIGVSLGYSMKMWMEYFINSQIIGVEKYPQYNNPNCMIDDLMKDTKCQIWIDDATDENIFNNIKETKFDVIIDDGSHELKDQIKSFLLLKSAMKKGGIYIIEDVVNIDNVRESFESLHTNCEVIDNRIVKGRYDDVLIIYRF